MGGDWPWSRELDASSSQTWTAASLWLSAVCVIRREEAFPLLHFSLHTFSQTHQFGGRKVHHTVLATNHWGCHPSCRAASLCQRGNWVSKVGARPACAPLTTAGTRKDGHLMAQLGSPNTFPLSQGPEPQAILVVSFQSSETRPQASCGAAATLPMELCAKHCPGIVPLMLWMAPYVCCCCGDSAVLSEAKPFRIRGT